MFSGRIENVQMPAAPHSISITTRDQQILEMIYFYDTCAIEHLETRFFPQRLDQISLYGRQVACYRRLAELREAGFVKVKRLGSTSGIGSGKMLISLDQFGIETVSQSLELPRSEVRRLKQISTPEARDHHLQICDFRLALELACERYSFLYLEWVSERRLAKPPITKVEDPRQTTKPPLIPLVADGLLTIRIGTQAKGSFRLEVERHPLRRRETVQTKLAGYSALGRSESIPTLWVVPDLRSQQVMSLWALELCQALGSDPSIIWITTRDNITPDLILEPIWQAVGVERTQSLIPDSLIQRYQFQGGPNIFQPAYAFVPD
jgi:hypothetical protein